MQSDTHKCIFIHIPKCAGTTIRNTLQPLINGHASHSHQLASSYDKPELKNYFRFSFVRNPWDRFVSAFLYLKAGGARTHFNGSDWDDEIIEVLKIDQSKNFADWVSSESTVQEAKERGQHFRAQSVYLDAPVDFIGRFESLSEDFEVLCNKINLGKISLPHKNKTKQNCRRQPYYNYYTSSSQSLIEELYKDDIENFGYKFK